MSNPNVVFMQARRLCIQCQWLAHTHIGPLLSFEVEHHAFNQAFKPINFQHKWISLTILIIHSYHPMENDA